MTNDKKIFSRADSLGVCLGMRFRAAKREKEHNPQFRALGFIIWRNLIPVHHGLIRSVV
jgi:hypothetical protein